MAKENRGKWKHLLKWLMQERKKKTTFHSLLLTLYGTPTICPTVGFQFSILERMHNTNYINVCSS